MSSIDSFSFSPTKTIKVRRKLNQQSISYRTIKIAKRVKSSRGLPQPLTCEEDFVLEMKDSAADFLRPTSGYYRLPEIGLSKAPTERDRINPRDIVGPFQTFESKWKLNNDQHIKNVLKKNNSLFAISNHFISKAVNSMRRENKSVRLTNETKNKVQEMHEKHQAYWNNINRKITRQATIKTNLKRQITSVLNTPIA